VSELVSGVLGKFSYSVTWMFAAATVTGTGWLLASPAAARLRLAPYFASLNAVTGALVFAGIVTALGFTMAAVARPLYQVLEGYTLWPRWLRARRIQVHRRKKGALEDALAVVVRSSDVDAALQERLLGARLASYPVDDHEVAPTRLGNALRAFETYGQDRYRLDSQTLWLELHTVTPKVLLDEVTGSRVSTDFFVALVYLTAGNGFVAAALSAWEQFGSLHYTDVPLILASAFATFVGPLACYRLAVWTTTFTAAAVRAMVNLGRPKLAETLGLGLPSAVEDERELWGSLSDFVGAAYDSDRARKLDLYRLPAKELPVVRVLRPDRAPARQAQIATEPASTAGPDSGGAAEPISRSEWIFLYGLWFIVLVLLAMSLLLFTHNR
jgi:hypothetical protein